MSDADQVAADADRAGASDAAGYEQRAAARVEGTRLRLEAGALRDEAAAAREAAARERDELAAKRDWDALARDKVSGELDRIAERVDRYTSGVEVFRARAGAARTRAAADREQARRDRELAAHDRELGAHDRELARRERQRAGSDELTGARRRGVGLEEFQREIQRVRRTGASLVAVFVDVDNLKAVNDSLGHPAGDALLRDVVDALKRHLRAYDLIIRFGGDEFLCALSDVSLDHVRQRFEDLNAELRSQTGGCSVSLGFGELGEGDGPTELIERADRDLLATRKKARQ